MTESVLEEELLELQAKNLYRQLKVLVPSGGTRAIWHGEELTLFCGNDYLGLSQHPQVLSEAKRAIEKYGVGAGASRLISGTTDLHERLESAIAAQKRKEKALVFSAGYLANLGVITALMREKDLIVMDKLCHASLIDGARLSGSDLRVFPHKNYERCEALLAQSPKKQKKALISETVFSMDGDLADLKELVRLKKKYNCLLIVDDAHGTGAFGSEGRGAIEALGLENEIDVITGTLSKSVGVLGGFAAASARLIDYLTNVSRPFIFATALAPSLCAAALAALELIRDPKRRERLWINARRIHQALTQLGLPVIPLSAPILPVLLGSERRALEASKALLDGGCLVPAIRYPTVRKGQARLRITVSAMHQETDCVRLIQALKSAVKGI